MKRWMSGCIAAAFFTAALSAQAALPEPSASEEAAAAKADVSTIDRATIDTSLYLDYAAGIRAGVYRWVLSEDGSYYVLAAIDESGAPIAGQETRINVGANNEERGPFPEGGRPGGPPPDVRSLPMTGRSSGIGKSTRSWASEKPGKCFLPWMRG